MIPRSHLLVGRHPRISRISRRFWGLVAWRSRRVGEHMLCLLFWRLSADFPFRQLRLQDPIRSSRPPFTFHPAFDPARPRFLTVTGGYLDISRRSRALPEISTGSRSV